MVNTTSFPLSTLAKRHEAPKNLAGWAPALCLAPELQISALDVGQEKWTLLKKLKEFSVQEKKPWLQEVTQK